MPATKTLYDEDSSPAWSGSNEPLDRENLAEEIEDLGKSNRRELRSRGRQVPRPILYV